MKVSLSHTGDSIASFLVLGKTQQGNMTVYGSWKWFFRDYWLILLIIRHTHPGDQISLQFLRNHVFWCWLWYGSCRRPKSFHIHAIPWDFFSSRHCLRLKWVIYSPLVNPRLSEPLLRAQYCVRCSGGGQDGSKMDDPAKDITEQSGSQTLAQGDSSYILRVLHSSVCRTASAWLCIPGCGRTGDPDAMEQLIQDSQARKWALHMCEWGWDGTSKDPPWTSWFAANIILWVTS